MCILLRPGFDIIKRYGLNHLSNSLSEEILFVVVGVGISFGSRVRKGTSELYSSH